MKSFKKWAEQNPEDALEFAKNIQIDVFRDGEDPRQEWIRQQSKSRKLKEEIRTQRETAAAELTAKHEAIIAERKQVEAIANQITYLSEMWGGATRKNQRGEVDPDFDTIDEAFKQNTGGMSIDDYNRLRARRGASNPEMARLRAENARLAKLAAGQGQAQPPPAPAGQTNGAAAPAQAANASPPASREAPAAAPTGRPADPAAFWGDDVPKAHPIRQFANWAQELDGEMVKYHDETLDEYSRDAEEIADKLLQRKLASLSPQDEDEPAPKKAAPKGKPNTPKRRTPDDASATSVPGIPAAHKLAPRGAVNTDRSHKVITKDEAIGGNGGIDEAGIRRRALERAMARARGELVD